MFITSELCQIDMISRCVPANYNSVFLVTFMIQHQFIPGFSFLGCLGAVYVKDSFPPENEALSWPNSDASFEELFKTHRKLSRGLGLPPSWWPDHKKKQKWRSKSRYAHPLVAVDMKSPSSSSRDDPNILKCVIWLANWMERVHFSAQAVIGKSKLPFTYSWEAGF